MKTFVIYLSIPLVFLILAVTAQIAQTNIGSTHQSYLDDKSEKRNFIRLDTEKRQSNEITEKKKQIDDCKDSLLQLSEIEDNNLNINNLTFFKSNDSFPNFIKTLGKCRTSESVPFLVKIKGKVALEQVNSTSTRGERVPVFDYFFAARALAYIGAPAIEPLLTELKNENDYSDLDIQLNALILKEIYGEQVIGSVLNELGKNSLSPKSARKAIMAKEVLEKYDNFTWGFNGRTLSPIESRVELKKKLKVKN